MKLKVFNKLGTGHFFIEVKSTRDIEVVAEEGFKFEYIISIKQDIEALHRIITEKRKMSQMALITQYKMFKGQQSFPSRLIHYLDSKFYKKD